MITKIVALFLLWKTDQELKRNNVKSTVKKIMDIGIKGSVFIKEVKEQEKINKIIASAKWAQSLYWKDVYCLPRSISLGGLLLLYGIDAHVQIGMRKEPPRLMHAWVEIDNKPINDLKERIFEYNAFLVANRKTNGYLESEVS